MPRKRTVYAPGTRFTRLTVLGEGPRGPHSLTWFECACDCGEIKMVRASDLTTGRAQSCGCLAREQTAKRNRTHGLSEGSVYATWCALRNRCENPNDQAFHNYGGRGIKVCERWQKFENFYADMGERPPGLVLDRIDNEGNYEPENCRWTTRSESGRNRRSWRKV